ncbi:MAG: hypothetical protein AAB262_04160, partial [Elusimicrobiota bacterium]
MKIPKRVLSGLLAALQIAWSFSAGAYQAAAQTVNATSIRISVPAVSAAPVSVAAGAASLDSAQSLTGLSRSASLPLGLQPVPTISASALPHVAAPAVVPAPGAALPRLPASRAAFSAIASPSQSLDLEASRRGAPTEGSSQAGAESFAAAYGEKLIRGREAPMATPVSASPYSPSALRLRPAASSHVSGEQRSIETVAAPAAIPAALSVWRKPAVRAALGLAAAVAVAAALPLLAGHAAAVAAAGSIALSVIGIPQIVRNAKVGREAVKDLAIGSSLIWFAAATLLSVVSIGQGTSFWWNAANVAGVAESAIVVGQINWHKRDRKELKATLLTAAAVLAPLPLIVAQVFLPLSSWLTLSFTAAMGLLWVLNWPQIRRNNKLFQSEGRAPKGLSPFYPLLVAAGSLLHLYAAVMGADVRWMMNASIAILTAGLVLAQIYMPRAANAVLGPLVRLSDRLLPGKAAPAGKAGLQAQARAIIASHLPSPSELSRYAGQDGGADLARAMERARALPGRSVVFLEAPPAAGKSTLADRMLELTGTVEA